MRVIIILLRDPAGEAARRRATLGKLAEAELHFDQTDGAVLAGLKLIGFVVWARRGGSDRHVTFPAKQYAIQREQRTMVLLQPVTADVSTDRLRDLILAAYAAAVADDARRLTRAAGGGSGRLPGEA